MVFLGWTHDLSCTHPAQTKKKKNHLNVKAIVQSLEEETRQENANSDDWQNQNRKQRNCFIEPPTKKSCMETTSLEFLG